MYKKILFIIDEFNGDEIFVRSANLAYYVALAMAPLTIIMVWLLSTMDLDLQGELIANISGLIGNDGARLTKTIVNGANDRPDLSTVSGWLGLLGLLLSAGLIFLQLQTTLNIVFDVKVKKKKDESKFAFVFDFLKDRLFSLGMVLTFIFIAIVSLIMSSALSLLGGSLEGAFAQVLSFVINFVIFTLMFSLIYKWMPDTKINFKSSILGGALTSVLFIAGKSLIGLYLGKAAVGSAYGAAGSLVVLLVWAFYSAVVFFLGAEVTYALIYQPEQEQRP